MPRQAARLVLGRSATGRRLAAEATLSSTSTSSRLQPFSTTTPHRWDDDANNSSSSSSSSGNNNTKLNDRNNRINGDRSPLSNASRVRSNAAASALGAMSSTTGGSDLARGGRPTTFSRPNVINLKSLPQRPDGAPVNLIRRTADGYRPGPGSAEFVPRFAGRSGGRGGGAPRDGGYGSQGGGRFATGIGSSGDRPGRGGGGFRGGGGDSGFRGGGMRGGNQFRGRGGFGDRGRGRGGMSRGRGRGGGEFRGRGGERGRGRGRGRGGAQGRGDRGNKEEEDDEEASIEDIMAGTDRSEIFTKYTNEQDKGVMRDYNPSTTSESLLGWGPAVATNTAIGQAETALRAMRIMGGGRAHAELEQTFNLTDENRWRTAGKPIMYSRLEQRRASAMMMLPPDWAETKAQKRADRVIEKLKEKHGSNFSAFVEDYQRIDLDTEPEEEREKHWKKLLKQEAKDHRRERTKVESTRVAITTYAVKGEHPEVEYTEDKWGRLARYHASNPGYRPADAAKFDEKLRAVVRT